MLLISDPLSSSLAFVDLHVTSIVRDAQKIKKGMSNHRLCIGLE